MSLDPTRRRLWRVGRAPLLVVAVVALTGLVLALAGGRGATGSLDPRAVDRAGSRALAEVLRDQGVRVDLVEATDAAVGALGSSAPGRPADADVSGQTAGAGTTLLVAMPRRLARAQLERLRDALAGRSGGPSAGPVAIVLIEPGATALEVLAPGVERVGPAEDTDREPDCPLPVAQRAGDADVGGSLYRSDAPGGVGCYGGVVEQGDAQRPVAALVSLPAESGRTVTVLGSGAPLTNERLDDRGNAALALGLLGGHPRLVWYLPSLDDLPLDGDEDALALVPAGVRYGLVMLTVAVVLLALWRGRRLGPVVPEPLPVVVRAAETAEGRARLYRRTRARDRAADALREATRERLRPALGQPRGVLPGALVEAVAARTGVPASAVGDLLYGGPPADDAALTRLATELDSLEAKVRGQ